MIERRQQNKALPVAVWSLLVTVLVVGGGILLKVGAAQQQIEKVKDVPERLATVEAKVQSIEEIKASVKRIEDILLSQPSRSR